MPCCIYSFIDRPWKDNSWRWFGIIRNFVAWLIVLCNCVWLYYHKIYIAGVWLILCRVTNYIFYLQNTGRNSHRKKNRYLFYQTIPLYNENNKTLYIYLPFIYRSSHWLKVWVAASRAVVINLHTGRSKTSMGITGPEPKYELDCTQKWRRRAE
jgi:hypothetical protein